MVFRANRPLFGRPHLTALADQMRRMPCAWHLALAVRLFDSRTGMFVSDLGWRWRRPAPLASSQRKPGAWLVTDGYGSQAWSAAHQKVGCVRAAGALGLEGHVNWCFWNDSVASQNKQWTQLPFAVWVHRNAYNVRTRSGHSLDSLSSISTSW